MVIDRVSVAIIDLHNLVERRKATKILANKCSGWYVCPREYAVAPSCLLDHELRVGHVLEVSLGDVNTSLPGALV